MSRVSTYVNFAGQTEEAFEFYSRVFGTSPTFLFRYGDMPETPGMPPVTEAERSLVMHATLPILAGHVLMATDVLESMGQHLRVGNNVTITLEPDTRDEADRLFAALSDGATETAGMEEMFYGYWGTCLDRYAVRWMVIVTPAESAG